MNIFRDTDAFYGDEDKRAAEAPLLSLFRLAKQIRLRLGPKGYLLDNYLGLAFESLNMTAVAEAVEDGVNAAFDLRHRLLCPITEGEKPETSHPLYDRTQEIYKQHPELRSLQEHPTRTYLLMALLGDEPLPFVLSELNTRQSKHLLCAAEMYSMQDLYENICCFVEESKMEELNRQLQLRFQVTSTRAAFLQGYANELLYQLTWRDPETSKQIFQLLLDSISEET